MVGEPSPYLSQKWSNFHSIKKPLEGESAFFLVTAPRALIGEFTVLPFLLFLCYVFDTIICKCANLNYVQSAKKGSAAVCTKQCLWTQFIPRGLVAYAQVLTESDCQV